MNEFIKTGAFVAAAVGLGVFAWATLPTGVEQELFSDQGDEFFPEFTTSDQAAEIQVTARVDGEKEEFAVAKKDGDWVIPTQFDYPADATQQMADAATLFIGLRKARVRSDLKPEWETFGVLDPRDDVTVNEGGVGRRVTFKDATGNVLADLIIGKKVEESGNMHFVRLPDKKRVYEAEIPASVPTDFEEWIEKDVLKAGAWELSKIEWDNYSVDETRGDIVAGDKFTVAKNDTNQWALVDLPDGEETDVQGVTAAASAISGLRIVGVRPKPEGLSEVLGALDPNNQRLIRGVSAVLQPLGFFVDPRDGRIVSNEGDLYVTTQSGVRYTLKFGELVYGSGKQLAEVDPAADPAKKPDDADPTKTEGGEEVVGPKVPDGRPNRYLMITVGVDPSLVQPDSVVLSDAEMGKRRTARFKLEEIRRAIQTHKDSHDGALPESLTALTEGDEPLLKDLADDPWGNAYQFTKTDDGGGFSLVSFGADGAAGGEAGDSDVDLDTLSRENDFQKAIDDQKAYDTKHAEAEKKAKELSERFGPWYYLIDATSYDELKVERADLIKKPEPAAGNADGEVDGGMPPIPGVPGILNGGR